MTWSVQQKDDGDVDIIADGNNSENVGDVNIIWGSSVAATLGRGTTDTDITFLALRNADGELCYIYPNATQDGITVSDTHP